NVLVLDTEVYSNTGGQQSKATPLGAAAKFAMAGKSTAKKDLGMEMMSYGHVYVARVALGAKVNQVVHALAEADAYPGPSLVIAYSPCIAHGYDLRQGAEQQKLAVNSGVWPIYRLDPRRRATPCARAPNSKSWRSIRASAPSIASPRGALSRGSRRCSSTATRRACRCRPTCATSAPSGWRNATH